MLAILRINLFLVAVLALWGCERKESDPAPTRKLNIVATVYPLADMAREVAGDLAEVTWVVESGQSMRGVHPDERLRNRLRVADLVLMGDVTEAWATEGSGEGEHYSRILRLQTLPLARQSDQPGLLWLDPLIVKEGVDDLASRLSVLRPRYTTEINQRSQALSARLDELYQEYSPRLRAAQNRRLLVLNPDFAPLLIRFSLLPVPTTVDVPPTRLSDENIRLLQYISRQNNTRLLAIPSDTPAAVVDDLRVRSGLQPVLLDPLGTSAASGRNTYFKLLRWNLDQLVNATTIQ